MEWGGCKTRIFILVGLFTRTKAQGEPTGTKHFSQDFVESNTVHRLSSMIVPFTIFYSIVAWIQTKMDVARDLDIDCWLKMCKEKWKMNCLPNSDVKRYLQTNKGRVMPKNVWEKRTMNEYKKEVTKIKIKYVLLNFI